MDYYETDDELVEALKKWWKANGAAVIAGILLGLAAIFGWRYWTSHQAAVTEQASAHYEALRQAAQKQDSAEVRRAGQALRENFGDSSYAVLAALELARQSVDAGDNAAAIRELEWVIRQARQESIKTIARLRLARVLLAEQRYADAEARLNEITDPEFTAEREELKGDLYLARNDPAQARTAYQAALAVKGADNWLQMKLDNLPVRQ